MARKGRVDRGLVQRKDAAGKLVWYARLHHEGRIRWFGSFKSKTEARDFYGDAKTDQRRGQFFPDRYQRTGSAKLKEVIEAYMSTNRNKSVRDDERYATFWKERFPEARLSTLTPAVIERAKQDLLSRKLSEKSDRTLSPQSVLHYLKFLRHVLNRAKRDGKLDRNPLEQVTFPKVSKGRLRFLSLEEEATLCDKIGPTYAPWVRVAILTGLRRMEQLTMKWADVDLQRGLITLPTTKAGGVQYIHLNQEATRLLEALIPGNTSVWVFPGRNPDMPVDPFNFYHRVYVPAVKEAKLDGVTWPTLRHTFASRLAMAGATEGDIAACLRHSTTALVRRYAHLSPTHLRGVMEKVSAFGKSDAETPKPSGTVEGSEIESRKEEANLPQVVEIIGAGEGT